MVDEICLSEGSFEMGTKTKILIGFKIHIIHGMCRISRQKRWFEWLDSPSNCEATEQLFKNDLGNLPDMIIAV